MRHVGTRLIIPSTGLGGVHFSFAPGYISNRSILSISSLDGSFNSGGVFRGTDFSIGGKGEVFLINTGNYNGAALLGVVVNSLTTSNNGFGFNTGLFANCFSRIRTGLSLGGATVSRI